MMHSPINIRFFSTCLVLYNVRTEYASTISLHEQYNIMVGTGHCTSLSFFIVYRLLDGTNNLLK